MTKQTRDSSGCPFFGRGAKKYPETLEKIGRIWYHICVWMMIRPVRMVDDYARM